MKETIMDKIFSRVVKADNSNDDYLATILNGTEDSIKIGKSKDIVDQLYYF